MALSPEDLARIRHELDVDLERRLARTGYHRPEPREPEQTAVQKKKLHDDAWNAWVNTMIDQRLSIGVIPAVGIAIAKKAKELRGEMERLAEEIGAVTGETARRVTALEAELAEVKAKLAEAEARLARVTAGDEHKAALLPLPAHGWIGTA